MEKFNKIFSIFLFSTMFLIFTNSKAVFNIGILILLIITVWKVIKYKELSKDKLFYFYGGVIVIGVISNLSNGTLAKYFYLERSAFYFIIFILSNANINSFKKASQAIIIGSIIGGIYSGISYLTPTFLGITTLQVAYLNSGRMESFVNVIRWSSLLQIATVLLLAKFLTAKTIPKIIFYLLELLLLIGNIFLNGTRAGMLGTFVSLIFLIGVLIYVYKGKALKVLLPIILIISVFVGYVFHKQPYIKERVVSIIDIKHPGNIARVDLIRVGVAIIKENPIFGVGSGNAKNAFDDFIKRQNTDYLEKNYNNSIAKSIATVFENNYINLAVENGLLYLFFLNGIFLIIIIKTFGKLMKIKDTVKKIEGFVIIAALIGNKIFTFFFPGTDNYVEFIAMFLLFYLYKMSEESDLEE